MKNIKIVSVVPIKLNNERLPGKNIKLLGDRPLIQYILQTLTGIIQIDTVFVYCSDEYICDFLPDKARFLKRPTYLDSQSAFFNQIFDCFISEVEADIYVYTHATSPFLRAETVIECIEAVKMGKYDSAFAVSKIQDFLWMNGKPLNFDPTNVPRSQDLTPIYRETSGLYVFTRESYLEGHARMGKHSYKREVSFKEAIDINNPEDFELAEYVLNM